MMYLQILHGDTMWYTDKDFYMEAFDALAEYDTEFAATLAKFKEDIGDLYTGIRTQQQLEDSTYTATTVDGSQELLKQTRKLEHKEYK
jgi:hypothetical protein